VIITNLNTFAGYGRSFQDLEIWYEAGGGLKE